MPQAPAPPTAQLAPSPEAAKSMRMATRAAVGVALLLAIAKAITWILTDSLAVASSMADSLADLAASSVNLIAVQIALKPADNDHRFGHGKAEAIAGLVQSAFVGGSAMVLAVGAVDRLVNPQPIHYGGVGIATMLGATVITIALVVYQRRVAKRTGSLAIAADSVHYASDVLTNLAAAAGILLTIELDWWWADPVCGLAVVVVLWIAAFGIARQSIDQLMDRDLGPEVRAEILAIALADHDIVSCTSMRTRGAGPTRFVELHLALDPTMPLQQAHDAGERVANAITLAQPGTEVTIHHDPAAPTTSAP